VAAAAGGVQPTFPRESWEKGKWERGAGNRGKQEHFGIRKDSAFSLRNQLKQSLGSISLGECAERYAFSIRWERVDAKERPSNRAAIGRSKGVLQKTPPGTPQIDLRGTYPSREKAHQKSEGGKKWEKRRKAKARLASGLRRHRWWSARPGGGSDFFFGGFFWGDSFLRKKRQKRE